MRLHHIFFIISLTLCATITASEQEPNVSIIKERPDILQLTPIDIDYATLDPATAIQTLRQRQSERMTALAQTQAQTSSAASANTWLSIDCCCEPQEPGYFTISTANTLLTIEMYLTQEMDPYKYFNIRITGQGATAGTTYYDRKSTELTQCMTVTPYMMYQYECSESIVLQPGNYAISLTHSEAPDDCSFFYIGECGYSYIEPSNITGNNRLNPFNAGTYSAAFQYSDTQNTAVTFTNDYEGRPTNDVFYKFVLNKKMDVTISHCDSELDDTYLLLLSASGEVIGSNNDYTGVGQCSNTKHAYLKKTLTAGTYYVVSEGFTANGSITTTIRGDEITDSPNIFGYPDSPEMESSSPEAVGGIGGSLGVLPTGAATYTIPIDVPPGVGGMQPSIAIVYNSQAGNGIAGWGCNIAGISAITRAPKTIYHDTHASGINHDVVDAFLLDGQRLIHDNDINNIQEGEIGAVYHPENEPLIKVTIQGAYANTNDNRWFKVEREGMVYYYGRANNANITDSQQKYSTVIVNTPPVPNITSFKINAWYLGYVEDVHGNYMTYNYTDKGDAGALYINSITYGKNTGSSSTLQNSITFEYTGSRQDEITYRMDGIEVSLKNRLIGITCKTENNLYRTYTLIYNTTSDGQHMRYSRLTSVTVKNGAGEALKPITLNWNYLPAFSQTSYNPSVSFTPSSDNRYSFRSADMNGDGIDDLIEIKFFPHAQVTSWWIQSVRIHLGSVDSNGNTQFTAGQEYYTEAFDGFYGRENCIPLDFDGSGNRELLVPVQKSNSNKTFHEYELRFFGGSMHNKTFIHDLIRTRSISDKPVYTTGDMNNDGKDDFIFIETVHNGLNLYPCFIAAHDQGNLLKWGRFYLNLPSKPEKMFVADFNGDGLNDILIFYTGGYKLFWNQGNDISNQTFSNTKSATGTNIKDVDIIRMGDFNGDGLPDFFLNAGSPWLNFAINNGDGTFNLYACEYIRNGAITDCQVFDFDMDGISDLVITQNLYPGARTYWMRTTKNSSSGLWELVLVTGSESYFAHDSESGYITSGDFNGDGQIELINYGHKSKYSNSSSTLPSPVWRLYSNPNYGINKGKITSITDSYGTITSIAYASFARDSFYTSLTGAAAYPAVYCTPPLHAVKTITTGNGVAGNITIDYEYLGLKLHLQGKGFLGMTSTKAINKTTGVTEESGIYAWNNIWYAPSKTFSSVKVADYTTETIVDFSFVGNSSISKKVFIHPNKKMEREIEFYNPVSTVTSFYDFDANHNPTRDSVLYGNSNMYRVVRYGRYTSTQSGYKPRLVTAVQKHSDDVPFVQRTQLAYNTKGLLSKKTENYNLADSLSTEYSYDGFGNLKSARVSGAGVNPVTAHTIYDATGRFPTRQYTVPASEKAAFKYDTWGNVIEERDVTNPADTVSLLTTHSYDGWGSRTLTTLPGGRRVKYQSGWVNNFSNKRYFTLVQGDGIPWVKTWYDAVGRETSVETIGPKGIAINKHYAYHYHNADNPVSRGQLSSSSTSQGYQNVIISEHFTYDSRGRLQTQQYISDPAEPDLSNQPTNSIMGKEITYSYGFNNGKKYQTATINGKPYKKTFDAWGGFYESEDALGNKVSYQYHSSGQPKKITAAGAVFNMTYHATGKQETLEDPNAGTVTYTYDAAGRLKTIKDSRNTLTTIHYDRLGRDSCMVQGSINTTWTYGTTNNYNLHRLVKKQTGNNYISYTYNQYGQPQTESRSIEGVILDFSYLYNNKGQLQQTSYPNSLDITNEYDAYGNLVKILAGTQAVWELTGNTGIMTTAALHGDAMTATAERNMMGYLTSLKTTKANTQIRDMAFVFDPPSGNLTSRTGMMDDKETFRYDHIDRLEEVLYGADAQTLQMKMEYAGNGNIISKTGLGTYTYGNMAGPHAVTGIQDAGQLINPRGQKIEYTVFHKASLLKDTVGNDAYELAITYGPDQQRWKTVLKKNGSVAKTVIFADNYERITRNDTTTHLYYVNGGIYVKQVKGASTILKNEMYYVHPDHLGSLMTITDAAGNIKQKSAFDAWGKRTFVIRDNSLIFDRGYTGHEHLDEFGLINMNGRMYNPIVGRFLSPDPFVQAPDFSQSYNRYSYVLNNPLIYTDPNGEFIFKFLGALLGPVGATIGSVLDAACWGASIGGGIYTVNAALNPGGLSQNWNSNDFWRSAGVGAISGAFGAGAGMLTQGLQIYGAAPGALVKGGIQGLFGGLGGGFGNVLMENDWDAFGKGFTQGFTTGFIMGSISGGIEGYKNAKSVGANKWTGRLYTDETTYSTTLKQGIPLQPNPERDCYGYALEYADSGHGNRNAAYFLGEANNAPGADVGQVFKKADARNFNWSSRISESQWDNVGGHLSRGKEILATTSRDGMNHWVNLTSVTTANKLRVIGGGFRRVLQSTSVWDPIRGHVSNGPASFFSVVSLF